MPRRRQSIPAPTHIESEARKIFVPIIDAVERMFLRRTNERSVSRDDLLKLGLVTEAQLNELED